MDKFAKGWYSEVSEQWKGQAMSLQVKQVLFDGKSDYQHVEVFESETYGKVLCLDGVIQLTERDEFAYQEMLTHLPLMAHANPEHICLIGGGDGAILTQVIKHKSVKTIDFCEIDQMVIDKSKEFFPQFKAGLEDPRVNHYCGDGAKFLANNKNKYDIILVDSSDPIGPAESLFKEPFYVSMHQALNDKGMICTQGECVWNDLELIKSLFANAKNLFKHAEYAFTTIPTYPSGQIGFFICSKEYCPKKMSKTLTEAMSQEDADSLRYYYDEIHTASFVLPRFAAKALAQ